MLKLSRYFSLKKYGPQTDTTHSNVISQKHIEEYRVSDVLDKTLHLFSRR